MLFHIHCEAFRDTVVIVYLPLNVYIRSHLSFNDDEKALNRGQMG